MSFILGMNLLDMVRNGIIDLDEIEFESVVASAENDSPEKQSPEVLASESLMATAEPTVSHEK